MANNFAISTTEMAWPPRVHGHRGVGADATVDEWTVTQGRPVRAKAVQAPADTENKTWLT